MDRDPWGERKWIEIQTQKIEMVRQGFLTKNKDFLTLHYLHSPIVSVVLLENL